MAVEQRHTRRGLLARGAALAGALALPARALAAATSTTTVYKLDTGCGHGSCACTACFYHASYSLFPTEKAANGNRAHIGCNCTIRAESLDSNTYVALFGDPSLFRAYRVDTRWPWVRAILDRPVSPEPTSVSITSSANPALVGQPVSFVATVQSTPAGAVSGTVTFYDGGTELATVALASNQATFTTNALADGQHTITARYKGNATHAPSTSSALAQTVNLVPTSVTVASSKNPAVAGQPLTFTATVKARPRQGLGGTVTFYDGATALATVPLRVSPTSGDVSSFTTKTVPAGSHRITARYNGNATHAPSTSSVLTQTVRRR
jgi:hypothetical protein